MQVKNVTAIYICIQEKTRYIKQ